MTEPTPAPTPKAPAGIPPWLAALLTIVATIPGILHQINPPSPTPPKPITPPVVVHTPIEPAPLPVVVPTIEPPKPITPPPVVQPPAPPQPPRLIPTATITATDAHKKPIKGPIEPGSLFTISSQGSTHAAGAIRWTVDQSDPEDSELIAFPDGTGFIGSLKAGASIGFTLSTAAGDFIDTAQIRVTANRAPQPPPVPVVVTPPAPTPTPTPDAPLRVLIAFESSQNHTRDQLTILNSTKLRQALDAACVPDSGLASWRQWDKDTTGEKDPSQTMRELWKQSLPQALADGLPALIVARGAAVTIYPLPTTEAAALAIIGGK